MVRTRRTLFALVTAPSLLGLLAVAALAAPPAVPLNPGFGAMDDADPPWGEVTGGLQSRASLDGPSLNGASLERGPHDPPPCVIGLRYEVRNTSDVPVTVWRKGFFVNHRIDLTGPDGEPAEPTKLGAAKRREFLSPGGEKRAPHEIALGEVDDAYDPVCLEELFEFDQPGEYLVRVIYQETPNSPRVESNELVVRIEGAR